MEKHEHKKELRDRVGERCIQLNLSLVALKCDPQSAGSERARAVEEALAALEMHVSGGWDSVDDHESAALTRWLDSSRFLFDTPATAASVIAGSLQS
jgi:hypothetical protein